MNMYVILYPGIWLIKASDLVLSFSLQDEIYFSNIYINYEAYFNNIQKDNPYICNMCYFKSPPYNCMQCICMLENLLENNV